MTDRAHFVAARPLTLANSRVRRGQRVDVSGWPGRVIAAHVRTHALWIRSGDKVGIPAPRSRTCDACGMPYAGVAALADHRRLEHGFPGEPDTCPELAVTWFTVAATHSQRAAAEAGDCPACGETEIDAGHIAQAHPELTGLNGGAAEAAA